MIKVISGALTAVLLISGSLSAQNIAGKWRGEFTIQDSIKVPFNFEINKDNNVILINGEERLPAGKAFIHGDSLFIPLDQFDNILAFKIIKDALSGVLRKQDGKQDLARLTAVKGLSYRFKETNIKPLRNYSGKYEVVFKQANGKEDKAVGLFEQKGKKLVATFMKSSGDTRYQEGIVQGDKFFLSSFIGSTPGYYYGRFLSPGDFEGEQVATKSRSGMKGKLNPDAVLPDAYSLATTSDSMFSFSLPDANGNMISLSDERFKNKPVIVALTGTWCPNCMDEARFLSPWYLKNRGRGIEVVAVHFEMQNDSAFARKVMTRYKQQFNIDYTQVFGGTTAKEDVQKALPGLQTFRAFPTTIFIDRKGKAVKVHSGFSGPATGKYYEDFIREFNQEVDILLNQ